MELVSSCGSVQIKGKACFFRQPSGPSVRFFIFYHLMARNEGKEKER
ncbi:hypothetical protein SLEP1_g56835 [Rubroshorea leprosula]|uniref:Uncharacterized protein n=1 Tax=Rubroshorea leprosula TaxID=152421 RepID=A0AAV5MJG2_9ROSI|nr:hypothetical protein SLEP1_g56835 [Rubroshorea leprosula]